MKSIIESIKRWFGLTHRKMGVATIPSYINHNPYVEIVYDSKLNAKIKNILDAVRKCNKVSWDLWEIGDKFNPHMAILDFRENFTNWSIANRRVQYCATKDEFMDNMMGLSLAHEIVEMKLVKSMDGSHGIIMILVCPDGDGQTNIDADMIETIASASRS